METAFPMRIIRPIGTGRKWPGQHQISRGVLVSTACGDKDLGTKLVLQNSNGRQTFCSATLHRVGYSDTFFWGRDHYTPCRHLNGLRGIVRYKRDTARGTAGEWLELDLWHDLPPAQSSTAATPHSPATTN
jgi:hypothetical protein